jgi:DUF1680 family protein
MRRGVALLALLGSTVVSGDAPRSIAVRPVVADRAAIAYVPVPYESQEIDGVLGDRMSVNLQARLLAAVDLDVLLKGYRQRPGQQSWAGEHIGKFIDAATNVWAYSGDAQLKTKLDTAVRELIATQLPDGYLGTYVESDRFKDFGEQGYEPGEDLPLWDVWAHKYNLLGLLNYYRRTGYEPALAASRRVGDLLCTTFGDQPGQKSIVRNDWHVGMANTSVLEPMAMLYRYTGDTRYLDFCRYIVRAWNDPKGPKIVETLMTDGHVNDVANGKAYEMTSNFLGLLELYRATGEHAFLDPVLRAWDDVVRNRLYITGTTSWGEIYRADHVLRADGRVGEGCVTTTWMQLNVKLLRLTGEAKYAAELERTIYNALLAAQHPKAGTICYFTPLNGTKPYGAVSQGMPGVNCCTSSVPRGLSLIPAVAWGTRGNALAVNLFVPGRATLTLPTGDVSIESATRYPLDGNVTLTVRRSSPAKFPIAIRVPAWCRRFAATVGSESYSQASDGYVTIERMWSDGDQIRIALDLTPELITGAPTYPDAVAVRRGPQILAADERVNPGPRWTSDIWIAGIASTSPALDDATTSLPKDWKGAQAYTVKGYVGNAALGKRPVDLVLVPIADAGQTGSEYRVWLQKP